MSAKLGRPNKLENKDLPRIKELIKLNLTAKEIAKTYDISENKLKEYLKKNLKTDNFVHLKKILKSDDRISLQRTLWKEAKDGNVTAMIYLDKKMDTEDFISDIQKERINRDRSLTKKYKSETKLIDLKTKIIEENDIKDLITINRIDDVT